MPPGRNVSDLSVMPPTVSVVIPTYNRARLLAEALDSVLQQTCPPAEIIVIDDGSKDDTAQAMVPYGGKVRYVCQENAGPAAARNHGMRLATGDFIALLDSDDLWVKDRLERQLKALEQHPGLDLLFGLEAKFTAAEQFEACEIKDRDVLAALNAAAIVVTDAFGLLLRENYIPTSSVLLRRQCLARTGYMDSTVVPTEDYDLWIRLAMHGFNFGFVNAALCRRRLHEGNLVNQWVRLTAAGAEVLSRYCNQSAAHRDRANRRLSSIHYDLGSRLFYQRDFTQALLHLRRCKSTGRTRLAWAVKLAIARFLAR